MSGWVRPLVGRASVPPAGARISVGCRGHSGHPGRFSDAQLRALQRRVEDWHSFLAKKLAYAASDEPAVEQLSTDQSALIVTGMTS